MPFKSEKQRKWMHANEPKMAKKWEKKKKTEAFRPSDRKVLMVIGRDTINIIKKKNPKLKPSKQLGQALNSIFRAMTRDKSDANYQQYKKYFPKYNDKLLKRLSKAYFDQPVNVQNTFVRQVMDYSLKESVNEVSGVDVAKKVLKNKQHEKGIDLQTANLIVTIDKAYNKNPALQKKFRAIQLPKMKQLIMKYYG